MFLNSFGSFKRAASGTEQDGSQTIFNLSQINRIAEIISSSVTVIILLAPFNIILKVRSDKDVLSPSAIVFGDWTGINVFLANDSYASDALSGSARTTYVFEEKSFVDKTVPEAKPPPPTGHIIKSKSLVVS